MKIPVQFEAPYFLLYRARGMEVAELGRRLLRELEELRVQLLSLLLDLCFTLAAVWSSCFLWPAYLSILAALCLPAFTTTFCTLHWRWMSGLLCPSLFLAFLSPIVLVITAISVVFPTTTLHRLLFASYLLAVAGLTSFYWWVCTWPSS